MTIAPPCSAALPTIATITTETKNSLRPTAVAKSCSECTRISLTHAVAPVASASMVRDVGIDHVPSPGSAPSRASSWWRRRFRPTTREIEHEEHDRHRHRGDDDGVALGRAAVRERRGEHERDDRGADQGDLQEQ